HYVRAATAAADTLFPHDRLASTRLAGDGGGAAPLPPVADATAALSWLDSHRANLVAVARYTARQGWPQHAVELSRALWRHFEVGGHYQEALAVHASAEEAAQRDLDGPAARGLPTALANLGNIHWWLGDYRDAL